MSNVYTLRPDALPNDDTVRCLSILLREARAGRVTGIGFVAYVTEFGYVANATGAAYADPTTTLGMMSALRMRLERRLDGGNP